MKKNILALLTVISILTIFVGCSSDTNKTQSNENSNSKSGTLTMYTNAEFAPFEYFEGEKVVGVDADIAEIIAASAGKEL
ncbi:MAG TPA: ABC transporter substrate-binding protein, partial [Clostridiales bacterium]|nr:ABC transporter substrate-binding protein [Clostridiales bacterium]